MRLFRVCLQNRKIFQGKYSEKIWYKRERHTVRVRFAIRGVVKVKNRKRKGMKRKEIKRTQRFLPFILLLVLALTGCSGGAAAGESDGILETEKGTTISEVNNLLEKNSSSEEMAQSQTVLKEQTEEIPSATRDIFAMDTYMTLTGYGEKCEEALDEAVAEIERLDNLLSTGNAESEIAQLNQNGKGMISTDTQVMLEESIFLFESTEGAFDITIYPLMQEWGFTTEQYQVPGEDALQQLLNNVDTSLLDYDAQTHMLTLGEGQGIDLGAIAKGYTSNRVMEIFEEYELVSGVVSLGGNVQCYSSKIDGSPWRCGVVNPLDPDNMNNYMGIVSVVDKAVITSGGYERYFEDETTGEKYHHILNPETGYPADSGLISVTIVSENGMLADGLSTSVFIMGLEKAEAYWQEYGDTFDMILMTEEQEIYITEGLEDCFTTQNFPLHVIEHK